MGGSDAGYLSVWHYRPLDLTPTSDLYYYLFLRDAPRPLLDIGCSVGNLLSIDPERSVGIDLDPHAVEVARSRGLSADVGDLNAPLPYDERSFGCVNCRHVIEHVWQPEQLLAEIHRVLRPQGRLVLLTPDFRHAFRTFYDDHTHVRPLTRESLRRLALEIGFRRFTIRHEVSRVGIRQLVRRGLVGAEAGRLLYQTAYAFGIRQRKTLVMVAEREA